MASLGPDLLRLLAVPVIGWAAWRDVRTRRVPNRTWYPLAALGVALLAWDVLSTPPFARQLLLFRAAVSLGLVVPLAYAFWRLGGFGGADAKAFMVVAVLFPAYPTYRVAGAWLPLVETRVGVFSLTVLTNTVLLGALYPVALAARNAAAGRLSPLAVVGRPVRWDDVTEFHGRLLEGGGGFTRNGLDLDALRMYLRWRGVTLAELRADPGLCDPATLPADPNDPTDGAVATDGGAPVASDADAGHCAGSGGGAADVKRFDDPWGAEAFLADIDHGAYGTTPEQLRAGLSTLVESDVVWVSPGIPFLVPMFGGVLVALTYGDLLFGVMRALGLV